MEIISKSEDTIQIEISKGKAIHDVFFCYDLKKNLTANDCCCHEDSCPYAAKCLLMEPLSFDPFQDFMLKFSSSKIEIIFGGYWSYTTPKEGI